MPGADTVAIRRLFSASCVPVNLQKMQCSADLVSVPLRDRIENSPGEAE